MSTMDTADAVHDQLTIAGINYVRENSTDEFDVIVSTCQENVRDNVEPRFYYWYNLSDGETDLFGGDCAVSSDEDTALSPVPSLKETGDCTYELFEKATNTVVEHLELGHSILIHCHHGQSRSAAISIAALATYENTEYWRMFNRVQSQRPEIHPDPILERYGERYTHDSRRLNLL